MKKILLIVILAFTGFIANGQTSNSTRLDQIEKEIKIAVENGDYDKANILKQEKEVRLKIKTAIEVGDFDEAERLKAQLSKVDSNTGTTNNSSVNYEDVKTENTTPQNDNRALHPLIKNGVYLEWAIIGPASYNSIGIATALRFGYHWYFAKEKPGNFKFGFDLNYIEVSVQKGAYIGEKYSIAASPVRPGFLATYFFSEKMAIGGHANLGLTMMFFNGNGEIVGASFNPGMRFRIDKLSLGFDLTVAPMSSMSSTYQSGSYSSFLLVAGFKF